jgi:ribosomal-protein-alanine N-acetyltransferase
MSMRRATLTDLDTIMELERAIFPDDAWSADLMSEGIVSPYAYYLVAENSAGDVIGYGGAFHLPGNDSADIHSIAVAKSARGTGIGARLFDELLAWCASDGATRVLLEVRADNPIAQSLYVSRGFTTIAVREGYYQPADIDALVMERKVTS